MGTPEDHAGDPADAAPALSELEARNAELVAELEKQNETLEAAVAASKVATSQTDALTDEDVRRLEHPDEFAG